jgi:hypothetical protein
MSKRELKKYVNQLSKEQLEEQILEMYDKFLPVKTYYNFVFNPDEAKLIRGAKFKISSEFFPVGKKRPKMRRSISQKYIKHFMSLGVDSYLIADLMLYSIEIAQTLFADRTITQQAFFKGMLSSFQQAIRFMIDKGILFEFIPRVEAIKERAIQQAWQNQFEFIAIMERLDY